MLSFKLHEMTQVISKFLQGPHITYSCLHKMNNMPCDKYTELQPWNQWTAPLRDLQKNVGDLLCLGQHRCKFLKVWTAPRDIKTFSMEMNICSLELMSALLHHNSCNGRGLSLFNRTKSTLGYNHCSPIVPIFHNNNVSTYCGIYCKGTQMWYIGTYSIFESKDFGK